MDIADASQYSTAHVLLNEVLSHWAVIKAKELVPPTHAAASTDSSPSKSKSTSLLSWLSLPGTSKDNKAVGVENFPVTLPQVATVTPVDPLFHSQRSKILIAYTKADLMIAEPVDRDGDGDADAPLSLPSCSGSLHLDELIDIPEVNSCLEQFSPSFETVETLRGTSFLNSSTGATGSPETSNPLIKTTLPYQICSWVLNN